MNWENNWISKETSIIIIIINNNHWNWFEFDFVQVNKILLADNRIGLYFQCIYLINKQHEQYSINNSSNWWIQPISVWLNKIEKRWVRERERENSDYNYWRLDTFWADLLSSSLILLLRQWNPKHLLAANTNHEAVHTDRHTNTHTHTTKCLITVKK